MIKGYIQILLVVETTKKCRTDELYIRPLIKKYYGTLSNRIRLRFIYMEGKDKYKRKEREILSEIKKFQQTDINARTIVIYMFDMDRYTVDKSDKEFLDSVKAYCKQKDYELVLFNSTIEEVMVKGMIERNHKEKRAIAFNKKNEIEKVNINDLNCIVPHRKKSNILCILDKYLERK